MAEATIQEAPQWRPDSNNREFWLHRELSKVKDIKRRKWLKEVAFAGSDGYRKFIRIMETREGAAEFESGEWSSKIPKFKNEDERVKARRRPCIGGCGTDINPEFTPWGELFEDFPAICPRCKQNITTTEPTTMSDASNKPTDALSQIEEAQKIIDRQKDALRTDLLETLKAAKSKLTVLTERLGFSFDTIFNSEPFAEVKAAFKIQTASIDEVLGGRRVEAAKIDVGEIKEGTAKHNVIQLMRDKKERSRKDILTDLKKRKKSPGNLYVIVDELEESGHLKRKGEGHKKTYRIAA